MLKSYFYTIKNAFDFSGRVSRKEYWMFSLISWLIPFIITQFLKFIMGLEFMLISDPEFSYGSFNGIYHILLGIYFLAFTIVGIFLSIKRLHDIGKSGSFIFIGLIPLLGAMILFVMYVLPGDVGTNKYGEDPLRDKYLTGIESEEEMNTKIEERKKKIRIQKIIVAIVASIFSIFIALGYLGSIALR